MVKKKEPEIINLDNTMLSADTVAAWRAVAERIGPAFLQIRIRPSDIPDERARVELDGALTIFVTLPGGRGEISLRVPAEHWLRKQ